MRIQGHGSLNILCRCIIRRSATRQREHGFLLDQPYAILCVILILWQPIQLSEKRSSRASMATEVQSPTAPLQGSSQCCLLKLLFAWELRAVPRPAVRCVLAGSRCQESAWKGCAHLMPSTVHDPVHRSERCRTDESPSAAYTIVGSFMSQQLVARSRGCRRVLGCSAVALRATQLLNGLPTRVLSLVPLR
jgi:hypothetical protein